MRQASAHWQRLAAWGREGFDAPPLKGTVTSAAGQLQTVTISAFTERCQGSGAIALQEQWAKEVAEGQNLHGGQGCKGFWLPKSIGGGLHLQCKTGCNADVPGPDCHLPTGGGSLLSSQTVHQELDSHQAGGSGAGSAFDPTSRVSPLLRSAVLSRAPQRGHVFSRQSSLSSQLRGISGTYRSWEWRSYSVQAMETTWEAENSAMLRGQERLHEVRSQEETETLPGASFCAAEGMQLLEAPRICRRRGRPRKDAKLVDVKVKRTSTDGSKQCAMCLKMRSRREFKKLRSSPDGAHFLCRGCSAQVFQKRRGLAVTALEGQAQCVCCSETKDKALFGADPRNRTGLQTMCRACVAEDFQTRPRAGAPPAEHEEQRGFIEGVKTSGLPRVMLVKLGPDGTRLEVPVPAAKVCLGCGGLKSARQFYRSQESLDGLRHLCKTCWYNTYTVRSLASSRGQKDSVAQGLFLDGVDELGACDRWLSDAESEVLHSN